MASVKDKIKETVKKAADKATAESIEAKKTVRVAARKVKDEAAAKADAGKKKAAKAAENSRKVSAAIASIADDQRVASEIEAKKNAAKASRKVKEAVEKTLQPVADKVDEMKLADQMARGRKKAERERKAAETGTKLDAAKAAVKKTVGKAKAAKLNIVIQSSMGGEITTEDIAARVPKDAENVYVRIDENKLYWVSKDGETGSENIW